MSQPLTESEVKTLVNTWYEKLDVHAPMVELLPFVIENGLYMQYPEAALTLNAGIRVLFAPVSTKYTP